MKRRSIRQLTSLKGRRALIVGGAGHIGLAACETLSELGAKIAVLDLPAGCARAARPLKNVGAFCATADLSDPAQTRLAVKEALSRLGGLEILVFCAAYVYVGGANVAGWAEPLERQTADAFNLALQVNLTSAFALIQQASPALARSGHGSVVLFSSIYGLVGPDFSIYKGTPISNPAGYGASKAGLLQLTRYFATALGPRVRVNAITPGGVERGQHKSFQARYRRKTPLGRMAVEEDLKGAVAYLSSDLSAYVTGHNLVVDGGWTAW